MKKASKQEFCVVFDSHCLVAITYFFLHTSLVTCFLTSVKKWMRTFRFTYLGKQPASPLRTGLLVEMAGNNASGNSVPVKDVVMNGPNVALAWVAEVKNVVCKRRLRMTMTDQVSFDNRWPWGSGRGVLKTEEKLIQSQTSKIWLDK